MPFGLFISHFLGQCHSLFQRRYGFFSLLQKHVTESYDLQGVLLTHFIVCPSTYTQSLFLQFYGVPAGQRYKDALPILTKLDELAPHLLEEAPFIRVKKFLLHIKNIVVQFFKLFDTARQETKILLQGITAGTADLQFVPRTQRLPTEIKIDNSKIKDLEFARLQVGERTYDIHTDPINMKIVIQCADPSGIRLLDDEGNLLKKESQRDYTIFYLPQD